MRQAQAKVLMTRVSADEIIERTYKQFGIEILKFNPGIKVRITRLKYMEKNHSYLLRIHPKLFLKLPGEVAQIIKAHLKGDLGDIQLSFLE